MRLVRDNTMSVSSVSVHLTVVKCTSDHVFDRACAGNSVQVMHCS